MHVTRGVVVGWERVPHLFALATLLEDLYQRLPTWAMRTPRSTFA